VYSSKSVSYAGYMSIKAPSAMVRNLFPELEVFQILALGDKEYKIDY